MYIFSNNYYGGLWASFNLETIQDLQSHCQKFVEFDKTTILKENESFTPLGLNSHNLSNFTYKWNINETLNENDNDDTKEMSGRECILKESRKFNIDLTPKVSYLSRIRSNSV